MSDLALILPEVVVVGDLLSGSLADLALGADGDLVTDDSLLTAMIISLFSDRRARPDDELPAGETQLRGFWGDDTADLPGDQLGSLLWLLAREKQTEATRQRAEAYAREALAWIVEDGLAVAVTVTAAWAGRGLLQLTCRAQHADGAATALVRNLSVGG